MPLYDNKVNPQSNLFVISLVDASGSHQGHYDGR